MMCDEYSANYIELVRVENRITELESAIRDELIRYRLLSIPLKFDFMRERGMKDLDEVHDWMVGVRDTLKAVLEG